MEFIPFLIAAIALAITPGPGIAYVVARTVAGGRAEGFASCMGTALGGFVHVLAASLGLSLLIAQSALAFGVLKYVGAAYLVYLGIGMLRRKPVKLEAAEVPVEGARKALVQGVLVETLNVKTAMFFLAFLPQFVAHGQPLVPQLVLLGSICVLCNTVVDVVCVLAAHRLLQSSVTGKQRAQWMNRISGCVMLVLAGFLALARRQV